MIIGVQRDCSALEMVMMVETSEDAQTRIGHSTVLQKPAARVIIIVAAYLKKNIKKK